MYIPCPCVICIVNILLKYRDKPIVKSSIEKILSSSWSFRDTTMMMAMATDLYNWKIDRMGATTPWTTNQPFDNWVMPSVSLCVGVLLTMHLYDDYREVNNQTLSSHNCNNLHFRPSSHISPSRIGQLISALRTMTENLSWQIRINRMSYIPKIDLMPTSDPQSSQGECISSVLHFGPY